MKKIFLALTLTFISTHSFAGSENLQVLMFQGSEACADKTNDTQVAVCEEFKSQNGSFENSLKKSNPKIAVRKVGENGYTFPKYAVKLGKSDVGYIFVKGARVTTITGKHSLDELIAKWESFVKPKRIMNSVVVSDLDLEQLGY